MRKYQVFTLLAMLFAGLLGGLIALAGNYFFMNPGGYRSIAQHQKNQWPLLADSNVVVPDGLNFLYAAQLVRPAVVHIKTVYTHSRTHYNNHPEMEDMLRRFHEEEGYFRGSPRQSSGSGVIITTDGYIVTNHHVIDQAGTIEVILNDKRSFKARLVGSDPSTDLALLKISAQNLPFVRYGDSESVQVGEWVLAIGNPFDLTSTVTAGIVSAKGRSINLLKDQYAIESFIQTDAAVNPGNSGGALVNLRGELIGVNTAIATQTGYYAGYSFAIPINIAKKVMDDLRNHGEIQRAFLGVTIKEVDAKLASENDIQEIAGVYILVVAQDGAAQKAGLKTGDIILSIDQQAVNSSGELQTVIATHRPGDTVRVRYLRQSQQKECRAVLQSKYNKTKRISQKLSAPSLMLGAQFSNLSAQEKAKLGIRHGVQIQKIPAGPWQLAGLRAGFIIQEANGKAIYRVEDLRPFLQATSKSIALDGIYPNGRREYYALSH
ncbi:MAG: Do family serine endopeptidase [Microscillaceae bacterium]|nr:Do family serine endopeptidase [Microscillaceae bacterium]